MFSGVPVARTTITTYAITGATAALAGILLTGYSRQSYLGMGNPYLFTSIAAVAIGGASILGGTGSYLGTVAGALVLTILSGVLPIFRLGAGALAVVYGLVILVTVSHRRAAAFGPFSSDDELGECALFSSGAS